MSLGRSQVSSVRRSVRRNHLAHARPANARRVLPPRAELLTTQSPNRLENFAWVPRRTLGAPTWQASQCRLDSDSKDCDAHLPWNTVGCYHRTSHVEWQSRLLYLKQDRKIGEVTAHYDHLDKDWKTIRLSDVDLSVRTSNCLYRMGLTTLGELASMSDVELLKQPNFGRKCLTEVRTLLSSTESLNQREECTNEPDTLDFSSIEEPILSTLLRSVRTLDLAIKARNVVDSWGITTVGELVQLTEMELLRRRNVGRLAIDNLKEELGKIDLALGLNIANWPKKDELTLIRKSRAQSRLDRTQTSVGTFKFLEDELCAAVKITVDNSAYAIVVRRTGWDGGEFLTLEELGSNPIASGRTSPVSRERIRQIENKALATIKKKRLSMPILERTVSLIEENAPLAAKTLPSLLERHQLTQRGLGFEAVRAAMKTFHVEWNLAFRSIDQDLFLLPRDRADTIESVWTVLIKEALRRDFVPFEEIVSLNQRTDHLASDVVALGVSNIPTLDWLDSSRRVYWSLDRACRGWNKIINVCRKILTVAPDVPFERLAVAVKRARTIRDNPSPDALTSMLCAMDDFDVQHDVVSRGANFTPDTLSKTDRMMISAARDVGTVTTFLKLREALVRQGVSTGYAQVLMAVTPLWITPSRGKYRFIAKEAQLKEFSLAVPTKADEVQESHECLVELEISHRHLVTGTHRIDENFVRPGQWSLRDEMGNNLGKLDVTANMVKGLNGAFAAARIGVGTFVIIDFSDEQFTATAYH